MWSATQTPGQIAGDAAGKAPDLESSESSKLSAGVVSSVLDSFKVSVVVLDATVSVGVGILIVVQGTVDVVVGEVVV